jgi:hypothetical protein
MDFPLRVELPRLSHLHALQLLLPFVPGTVAAVGLAFSTSSFTYHFQAIGLGYKTKLGIALALAYVFGLAAMTVTQSAQHLVNAFFNPRSLVIP